MPNHLHALIGLKNSEQSINIIVSNAKRFMAYELVKRLKEQDQKKCWRNWLAQSMHPTAKEENYTRYLNLLLIARML
jgi:hypothetical protein